MSIVTDYTYPVTLEEVRANRRKFVTELRSSADQCMFALYDAIEGASPEETKHLRCAIGVAGTVFFGIKSDDDLTAWETAVNKDIYDEVAMMLGISRSGFGHEHEIYVERIVGLNDFSAYSFSQIGETLAEEWGLL